jgi:predicted unusual protein kinase regulating ubiquinone biosynthesis (AarF/ABC1/UbiB family)
MLFLGAVMFTVVTLTCARMVCRVTILPTNTYILCARILFFGNLQTFSCPFHVGGGAKSINFQELAADLAEITFKFPFRIPPYFALIIRAISVLEGIALVGDPDFAIVDEAYPFIAKKLMTDRSPRLRAAFR